MRGTTNAARGPVATTRSGRHNPVALPSNTHKCWTRTSGPDRVHLTDGAYSADEAASALFNNAPTHVGRGSHLVVVRVPQGTELIRGTMPNEVFTYGSLRGEILFNGINPF